MQQLEHMRVTTEMILWAQTKWLKIVELFVEGDKTASTFLLVIIKMPLATARAPLKEIIVRCDTIADRTIVSHSNGKTPKSRSAQATNWCGGASWNDLVRSIAQSICWFENDTGRPKAVSIVIRNRHRKQQQINKYSRREHSVFFFSLFSFLLCC